MKSLMLLWKEMAIELAIWCRTSATLDCETVERRVETEGLSFLTIVLPEFGNDFNKSLDRGQLEINHTSFRNWNGGTPVFLQGFLSQVFDPIGGRLLDEPSIDAIFAIRQLTLAFGKIDLPISNKRVERSINAFFECENQVRDHSIKLKENSDLLSSFAYINNLISGDVFFHLDQAIQDEEIIPRHGPGATAEGISGNQKYNFSEWTERLERVFPYGQYALPNRRIPESPEEDSPGSPDRVTWREPGNERPVRVIHVPKTMKTPRVIAIEPVCMQFMQQAISERLIEEVHKDYILRDFIRFTDQTLNQDMARESSKDQSLATLDLSEASDRVSYDLVKRMFTRYPRIALGVDACRSREADVFGREIISLAKFASMGSALTFPIESLVFLTIIFVAIQSELRRPLTVKDIKSYRGRVRVYGDDLIVPIEFVQSVLDHLEAFGFKVNTNKSFYTGRFRESCGKDFYAGHDVSVTRVRRAFPSARTDVNEVVSLVSLRNQFYFSGMWRTARWLDNRIRPLLGTYPTVQPTSSLLGRHSVLVDKTVRKLNEHHNPVVKGWVVRSTIPENSLDGVPALHKFFLKRGELPHSEDHLERSGRPLSVDIMQRWRPTY